MATEHIIKDYSKHNIAALGKEIEKDWKKPYFGAVPYIEAMRAMDDIRDPYYDDPGYEIVGYFLANASTWRGEVARAVKAELKKRLDNYFKRSK